MIIDASVAFKLIVEEPGSESAIGWLVREELVAPTLIHLEVGNALWKRVRRQELTAGIELSDRLDDLGRYIRTVDERPAVPRALQIAIEIQHPIYDCVYLALAELENDRLLTADRRFIRAVSGTSHIDRVEELTS